MECKTVAKGQRIKQKSKGERIPISNITYLCKCKIKQRQKNAVENNDTKKHCN